MDSEQGRSPEQWRLDDILAYLHLDDTHSAKEILHYIYGYLNLEFPRRNRLQENTTYEEQTLLTF